MDQPAPLEDQPTPIPLEDAKLAVEIFKKALEYRPSIKRGILGQDFLALSREERLQESLTRRISLTYADEDETIPCLFFRFVGDESPIVAATFYPYEAILSFLSEGRAWAKWISPTDSGTEEIEAIAFDRAINMTLIMLDNFYSRGELMMDSFTSEVIAQWRRLNYQSLLQNQAEAGEPLTPSKDNFLDQLIKDYSKQITRLWKYQGQTPENWRKLRLAEEYVSIYKHWKRLSKIIAEGEDWKEYAKAGKFHDTPDDLLAKLGNIDRRDKRTSETRVSELAIEHAARRVSLIKRRVNDSILKKRKKGIKVTGYSNAKLFAFLKQGRELADRLKAIDDTAAQDKVGDSSEQATTSAREKASKKLEQRIEFIQAVVDEII